MTGKPPKVKPVPAPTTKPYDSGVDSSYRPASSSSTVPYLNSAHSQQPLLSAAGPDQVAVTPTISVNVRPISSIIDELTSLSAESVLAGYQIPMPKSFGDTHAKGIQMLNQRQYVAVADDHIVQVVLDVESGLLRATQARELHPSGPLLKPDSEGRFWLPLDNSGAHNRSVNLHSEERHLAELFLLAGHSVEDFSALTIRRILAVSGIGAPLAHETSPHSTALALLQDTLRRFTLDQNIQLFVRQMQHPDPHVRAQADPHLLTLLPIGAGDMTEQHRALLFEQSERAFELDCDENTLQMRRIFPHLPKSLAQALWREASAADHSHMHLQPGMPRHIAEKALLALRDVRLARACEGIYLDSVASLDSDQLALQMIGQLDQWPRQVRIEIRLQGAEGNPLCAIGDARSPVRHTLIRQHEGYVIPGSGIPSTRDSMDLYATVWLLLLPEQRQLLGVAQGGGVALQGLIRAQPLPSRQSVSELLGLAPVQVTAVAGSAQYVRAGLRGGGDDNPTLTKSVMERVRDLYPQLADKELNTFISERLKSDASGVLARLEAEFVTLRTELASWSAQGLSNRTDSSQGAPQAGEQRLARERFSAKLQDIWQRKSVSQWGEGDCQFSYYVDFSGELPRLSSRFEHVTELILTANESGARIGAFLDSFPGIRFLGVFGIEVGEFPSGIFQMRQLSELTLDGCSLKLSEVTVEGLSRIETLTRLNLANNPLTVAPHVGYMAGLTGLMLSNANLSYVPSGIDALRKLGVVALHDNNISDVGYELFEIPDTQDLFVGLLNNPLSDASRQRISQYLENSSMDRKVEIQAEDAFSESDSDSESSESGISTGSDSD
ncbi:leucine-rich repeat domain-containing protein [Pseudomonas sp. Marseille-Q5117]|uniref:leucine-rich repeat domain-containing protein n=1 Tax=Pseudomonas sp. Marseille-Q5117 TaxID=2972777 RepID=UPI0021C8A36B|nr:hypothetical protein [Pseudomonas sp. Marseille-Q5117]